MEEKELEEVELVISLKPYWWEEDDVEHVPEVKVFLDDKELYHGKPKEPFDVKWAGDLEEDLECKIKVQLLNKDNTDTVVEEDGSVHPEKNVMIAITNIEMSGIDTEMLVFSNSIFHPEEPNEHVSESIENITHIGWNGTWEFGFTTPIYIWLLENL